MYDLSLRAVVDNLKAPGVDKLSPALRQLVLFDRAATAQDMGVMLVLDENGDSIIDAAAMPARKVNNADRADGVERFYTFMQVGDLPLVLNVALATREIEAEWRQKALVISVIVLVLCGLTVALSLLFGRELRRRSAMQAELAKLSLTDILTGLPNRRAFEDAFTRAAGGAKRSGKPLSLLIVDADHFKRFNDRYGHQVGDEVLQGLARSLSASVHRPHDLVSRVGGEEFAILLPDTDQAGALRITEKVHTEVSTLAIGSADIGAGAVTVSIGLACCTVPTGEPANALTDLYRLADAALYEAKAGGRNQTRCANSQDASVTSQNRILQLIRS